MAKVYAYQEVTRHNTSESCWVILYDKVYDVTSFVPNHPGGPQVVLDLAGTDATEEYDPVHPPGLLEDMLDKSACLGTLDVSTKPKVPITGADNSGNPKHSVDSAGQVTVKPDHQSLTHQDPEIDTLDDCLNLNDIERLATRKITKKAWSYYFSAADDLVSKNLNNKVYNKILLRPRIFRDCTRCNPSTTMVGHKVNLPIFVSPAAMARLAHPAGEAGIAAACRKYGVAQIISHNASQTPEQIVAEAGPEQIFGWQIYVQEDRAKSEKMLARIAKLNAIKFIVLTLDAPVPGKREHDERMRNIAANLPVTSAIKEEANPATKTKPPPKQRQIQGGVGRTLFAGTAADLEWSTTLRWLASHTTLPIILKGIQTHEDAYIASVYARESAQNKRYPQIKGIILSNHGGRALDTAPPSLHTLLEIRTHCPDVFKSLEVYLDGGIKRGTDVVKALALGAKGVGIGRAPLYGLGAGGVEGVEKVFEILKAEIETCLRLLGCEGVEDLGDRCVNFRALERDLFGPSSSSFESAEGAVLKELEREVRAKL